MRQTVDRIQVSYWFVPLVASVSAVLLVALCQWLDTILFTRVLAPYGVTNTISGAAARAALIGMAVTILTTTGVLYSLLTVPLTVASTQFGSRLLRLYLKDRATQTALGLFVAAAVYSLSLALVISAPRNGDPPLLISILVGFLMTAAAYASLIAIIHHIGVFLQAPHVAAAAGSELRAVIRSYVAQPVSARTSAPEAAQLPDDELIRRVGQEGEPILAENLGYVQDIDTRMTKALGGHPDLVVQLARKPGDFIHPGDLIARVWPPRAADERARRRIRAAYRLGNSRSPAQDIGYGVNQLVEMAVRAMSPAINDPFTAMTCLDHMGAAIALYSETHANRAFFYDGRGKLRVIAEPVMYGELLDAAFSMLRRAARDYADVLLAMLETIGALAAEAPLPEQRRELAQQARLIELESAASSSIEPDKARVRERCAQLLNALEA